MGDTEITQVRASRPHQRIGESQAVVELGMNGGFVVTEMTIVDTFTKLIFAVDDDYSALEYAVVDAFRAVEANVYRDSTVEMGEYLRDLGVREMIQLVARVERHMREHPMTQAGAAGTSPVGLERPH